MVHVFDPTTTNFPALKPFWNLKPSAAPPPIGPRHLKQPVVHGGFPSSMFPSRSNSSWIREPIGHQFITRLFVCLSLLLSLSVLFLFLFGGGESSNVIRPAVDKTHKLCTKPDLNTGIRRRKWCRSLSINARWHWRTIRIKLTPVPFNQSDLRTPVPQV